MADCWLLVEWVEHGLSDTEYEASVAEIREFEQMLMENQITLVKRSLETGREIHRTRLLLRAEYPEKRWKLAEGDIESNWHREAQEQTVMDLLQRFQTPPWHRIDVNQKEKGRLDALDFILQTLDVELKPRIFALNPRVPEHLNKFTK